MVSNISKDVTEQYLKNYLSNELKIEKENLDISLLLPTGRTMDNTYLLQYKVTVPEIKYSAIILSDTWPGDVRIHDFLSINRTKRMLFRTSKGKFFVRERR